MKFVELVLKNFGPYIGEQKINFNTNNQDNNLKPIVLLGGMNGGGKTTLMDAIRLALYGHRAQCSTRGNLSYGEFLSQCVNTSAQPHEMTQIELAFEHIENDQPALYRIVRNWSKVPKEGKDSLGIFKEEDRTWGMDGLASIWDEYIENILPLGISNLFLFDGEQVKELAEQDTPPSLVVEAIRNLLGLELAERLAIDIEILVNRKRKEIADNQELEDLEKIEVNLNKLQRDFDAENSQINFIIEKLNIAEKEQKEAFDKFVSEGGKIAGDRNKLEQSKKDKTEEIENTRQGMCDLAAGVLPLAMVEDLLTEAQTQGEKEVRIQQAQIARDVLLERDKRLIAWMESEKISVKQVSKIKRFLEEDTDTINSNFLQAEESWLKIDTETLSKLGNIIYYLHNSQKIAKQQLNKLEIKEEEIINLERQIQTAAAPEEYEKLVELIKETEDKVAELKAKLELSNRRKTELEDSINKIKKYLNEYTQKNINRQNTEHIIEASAKVQETLQLFREKLTLRKLNKLEVEVTECFRYLLHKSDLVHRISVDTDNFSLSLYDLQGRPVPKHRLSAGEKQLLAIAFLWGLARISGRRLPIAIDTPLGRLDSSHRSNLIERYFPSASHQVILLSTDTEIGQPEVEKLRENHAIAHEYLLKYDAKKRQTNVE